MDSKIIAIFTIISKVTALTTQEVLSELSLGANSTSDLERSEDVTKSPNSTQFCVADSSDSTKCVSREKRQLPCCFNNPYPIISLPCPYYNVNDGTCFMVSCPSGPSNCCDGVTQSPSDREDPPTPMPDALPAQNTASEQSGPPAVLPGDKARHSILAGGLHASRNQIKFDCNHTICQPSHIAICIKIHPACDNKQNNTIQLDTTTPNTSKAPTSNCCMTLIANCCKPECCEPVIEQNCSSESCCSQIIFQNQPCCGDDKNASNANGSGNNGACDVSVSNITAENGTIVVSSSGKNLLQTLCSLMTFQNCFLCNNFNVGHAHNTSKSIEQNSLTSTTASPQTSPPTPPSHRRREAPATDCYVCCKGRGIRKRRSRKGKFSSRPQPSHRP